MASHDTPKSRYDEAGVSISRGNELVQRIKHRVAVTNRSEVIGGIGGFGGLFDLSGQRYRNPVLVSGTDGVGTKLRLAIETGRHDSIGIDLVAMCVNDLLVLGAEPLFFLDYYATGQLDVDVAESVITGIIEGCRQAGCALLGGETAEMPGMYASEDYDLAGFCVGVVEKDGIIDGSRIRPGQAVLALASSGAHSNGYSLIRKVLADSGVATDTPLDGRTLIDTLLTPTRIYVRSLLALAADLDVLGMAHITGGGLIENIPRVLPQTVRVELDPDSWQWPALFHWLQEQGRIDTTEMHTVFNCGVGMVVIVDAADADRALGILHSHGETAWQIGTTAACEPGAAQVIFV